jgi:beta-N-acetylhexosaminidase
MARLEEKQQGTIRSLARRTGKALASLGLNVNLSPVMDVVTEKRNVVIGDRSFGTDPDTVTKYSLEYAEGLLSAGICPVMKHFPGHGMTREDSHVTLPRTAIGEKELGRVHLRPFIYGVKQGLPAILTSHVLYSSLDDTFPATLSVEIVRDLLRGNLGFQGVVISDDLSMGAVRSSFQCEEYVRLATEASVDIMIHCGTEDDQGEMFEELLRFYREEDFLREEKERISLRIEKFIKYLSLFHSL